MRDLNFSTSMKRLMSWRLSGFCLMAAALVVSGCRSTANHAEEFPSELATSDIDLSDPSVAQWKPTTFIDRPELQVGTGPMDADAETDFSVTDSGLKYRVLRKSSGRKPTASNTVTVNYRGWLQSGNVFDSSYEKGEPTSFPLRSVIAGWTEGMQLVGEGGMIELWVPSKLGYGERGSPGSIPAHSNLHFIVELVSVDS